MSAADVQAGGEATGDALEAAARAAWTRIADGLIRGVAHALGNRSHLLEMQLGDVASGDASAAVAELVPLIRLLAFASPGEPEATLVTDLLPEALALLRLHADAPGAQFDVRVEGAPQPVLVPRTAAMQAIIALLCDGAHGAGQTRVVVRGDDDRTILEWEYADGGPRTGDGRVAAAWLLAPSDGVIAARMTAGRAHASLSLPTLRAARRRTAPDG